jgi:hypothetical protein
MYLPEQLLLEYEAGRVCLFVGAGISRGCGLPDWATLAAEVVDRIPERRIPLGEESAAWAAKRPIKYINPDGLSAQAKQHLKEAGALFSMRHLRGMSSIDLESLVTSVLYDRTIQVSGSAAAAIARLRNLKRVCSFNYDDVLLSAFDSEGLTYVSVLDGQEIPTDPDRTAIVFLHGFLPNPRRRELHRTVRIVLSEDDYHDLYADENAWPNRTLMALVRGFTGLFVGCSLQDPNLRRLLHVAAKLPKRQSHYALLRDPGFLADGKWYQRGDAAFQSVQSGILRGLGVRPVWFGEFDQLPQILLELESSA